MSTSNEKLQNELITHQSKTVRLGNSYANKINSMIAKTEEPLAGFLLRRLNKYDNSTPNILSRQFQAEMMDIEQGVARIRAYGSKSISKAVKQANIDDRIGILGAQKFLRNEMTELAEREAKAVDAAIKSAVPFDIKTKPVPTSAASAIVSFTPLDGATLSQWFKRMKLNDLSRIMTTVRAGISANDSTDSIIKTIMDRNVNTTKNSAEKLARTAVNGISNGASGNFYKENADILKGEQWVATLDLRTCPECGALDGQIFKVGEGPIPPIHPNDRCTRIPVVDSIGLVGERPEVGGVNFQKESKKDYVNKWKSKGLSDRAARDKYNNISTSHKNKLLNDSRKQFEKEIRPVIGGVPPKKTFDEFLKEQTVKGQQEVLGIDKQKLYSKGKLDLHQFVRKDDGIKNLDELYSQYPAATRKAGLG